MPRSAKPTGRLAASLIGAVGVVLWATETMLVTLTRGLPPFQTVALAFVFAASMSPIVWVLTGSHPLEAFRQPLRVWVLTVVSLVGYHSCIYYATQQAPPATAALLQSTTPLMIVLASALLPGERLRWWHVVGALLGFLGVLLLIDTGGEASGSPSSLFYLALIGVAAALWGLYSVVSRLLPDVPSTALGSFYAVSALVSFGAHLSFETWVPPQLGEWLAVAALGILPMGLAIYFWDFGLKKGDMQALGAFSYVEPFIGAVIVAVFTGARLEWSLLWSGLLVIAGAAIAGVGLWRSNKPDLPSEEDVAERRQAWVRQLNTIGSQADLLRVTNQLITRLNEIECERETAREDGELQELLLMAGYLEQIWDGLGEQELMAIAA